MSNRRHRFEKYTFEENEFQVLCYKLQYDTYLRLLLTNIEYNLFQQPSGKKLLKLQLIKNQFFEINQMNAL